MVKTRGLIEARKKLGNVDRIIDNMLRKKKKIKIFESGCGYGRLIMDLVLKYGNRIDVVGMNFKKNHGGLEKMISNALKEKIILKEELKKIKLPKIIYGDAGEKIPLKTGSIDLVLSQTSVYLYKNKMNFFREVGRVLTKEGVGLITYPGSKKIPKEFQPLLKIYKKGKQISFDSFIKSFKNIRLFKNKEGWPAIEIKKANFDFGLELEAAINVNHLDKKLFGVQSIYYVK